MAMSVTDKFSFVDQLWRLMNSSKLENRHENWIFANKSWIVPEQGERGYIEDSDTNLVLTLIEYSSSSEIFLKVKDDFKIKF